MEAFLRAHLLLLLLRLSLVSSASSFTPNASHFLSCGASSSSVLSGDSPHRTFVPDSPFLSSSSSSSAVPLSNPKPPTSSPLYAAARFSTSPFSYRFVQLPSAAASYVLRLHFLPFSSQGHNLSDALFDVSATQSTLLSNFSAAGATASPSITEFFLWVDSGELSIDFTPRPSSFAFVNAIEVFTAPVELLDDPSPFSLPTTVSTIELARQVLETVYRVNVGGPEITPANDTLWRTWVPDDGFLSVESTSLKNSTTHAIYYNASKNRTREIAPERVYDTARTMNVDPIMAAGNPGFSFNVTWNFPVAARQKYLVRLHFCDIISPTFNAVSGLVFDVYMIGLSALSNLRPSAYTDRLAEAFYVDFIVDVEDSAGITVSIDRSSASSNSDITNAILNGLEIMKVINPSPGSGNNKSNRAVLLGSLLGGIGIIILVLLVILLVRRWRSAKPLNLVKPAPEVKEASSSWSPYTSSIHHSSNSADGTAVGAPLRLNLGLIISFAEIRAATDDFNEKNLIGVGGFGKVYKGVLNDGTRVAVKRGTPGSRQGLPEFQTEIAVLSRIRHRHLVSLIGYCDEQWQMILVYEYMEKGPLRSYLHGGGADEPCLTWKQRLEICVGAARALHYLHTGFSDNIIHRDVKSTNILLDGSFVAKVSDFGLSRLGPSFGHTHVSTKVKGSFGYLDPEYFKTQKLTDKSDVYSFGVVLLEVLCARPVIDQGLAREQINLAEWALHWQRRGQLSRIIDPKLGGRVSENSLKKFGETAAKCLADYGVDRPAMGDVLWNLEYCLQLQETEVRREPFEDSTNSGSEIPAVGAVRRVPSTSTDVVRGAEEEEGGAVSSVSDITASKVFSQLMSGEGR